MTAVRPTRLAFRGRVEASGLLLADSTEGRRRALACWTPGTAVWRGARGMLVRFAAAERIRSETAPGAVLVAQHGVWASAPLTAAEAAPFAAAAVLVPEAGALVPVETNELLDPSQWLDLSGFTVAPAAALPAPAQRIAAPPDVADVNLRARVAKDPETAAALLEALRASGVVKRDPAWKQWLKRLFRRRGAPAAAAAPAAPNAFDRLNTWLSKKLESTKVGRWLIDRQSAYFDRLSKMFDDDLDAALRHAIALEGDALRGDAGRSLGIPSPRAGLGINFGAAGGGRGPAIQMEGDRYERLRAQYREAAKKLEAEGRIEEAAFVLTDLLNAPLDAVALFERHQRWELAARLAEGKALDPALVVRLWFLAGDPARAVRVARKSKMFASAVAKLEATHPNEAAQLRMLWAYHLAGSGDFAGAVRAAWNVPDAGPTLLTWIDIAIEAGGPDAARLALLRLELAPADSAPVVAKVMALIDDPAPELTADRQALGEALLTGTKLSEAQRAVLSRPTARALVRDRALHGTKNEALLRKLLAGDEGALRTDVPVTFPSAPPRQRPTDFVFRPDASAFRAWDAAALPGGRTLAALGENGLAVIAADGRRVWSHDAPAYALAIAPGGLFAATLTPRGEVTNVGRLSLGLRRHEDWARVPLQAAAGDVHGGLWMVASGGAVLALDALATPAAALWQYPLGPDRLLALAADDAGAALLLSQPRGVQLLHLLAPRNLAQPAGPQWVPPGRIEASAACMGGFVCAGVNAAGQPRAWVLTPGTMQVAERVLEGPHAGTPALTPARVAVAVQTKAGVTVHVTPGVLRLHFELASKVAVRWQGDVLVCASDTGRVVVFDCAETSVLRQLAVKAGR